VERPWEPEEHVDPERARRLIAARFPELARATVEPFGTGWDNRAHLVDGRLVFRFPQRELAVGLMENESRVLPRLAARLPLAIPAPTHVALGGTGDYPWPFAGYPLISGRTACSARLDEEQRAAAAGPLGRFLAALHAVDPTEATRWGAPRDTMRRLDVPYRTEQIVERLAAARAGGLLEDPRPFEELVRRTPTDHAPRESSLVHGDLYVRHLLVDPEGAPVGVIDWGDVHVGDPAIDLGLVHGFLPASAHGEFREAYGPIDEATWVLARFRALFHALAILCYGADVGEADLVREGARSLARLRESL